MTFKSELFRANCSLQFIVDTTSNLDKLTNMPHSTVRAFVNDDLFSTSSRPTVPRSICSECQKPRSSRFQAQHSTADGALSICSRKRCRAAKIRAIARHTARDCTSDRFQISTITLRLVLDKVTGAMEVHRDPASPQDRRLKHRVGCFEADSKALYGHELPCTGEMRSSLSGVDVRL